ncbi:DNA phosphorothioation-associated putative methyltransferase [Bradyrhizobium sp. AUGA SZCCT0177]|uniref:DNA phosphorothioation-associated putative methyltransferase n=1 Tax=Bradyrhizobium sp. AUGA SZCCT0177 TaxID=2807665 RepID=UPI001BA7D226|nr:DNA phosphorothioation-associated putative methyltransferase [Bradyrhizobium sp. AUGA SZCCT0177]MBR1285378.1 DNA phosphorothioation-associated putative methyltransferase [Bradyrhizobium sp. AUGA SZCCT0177]
MHQSAPHTGKALGLRRYYHVDAISHASDEHQDLIDRARTFSTIADDAFNVVRVNSYASHVSFLLYPGFFEDPFPVLLQTVAVDLRNSVLSRRSYQDSLNPPILHRKELLLPLGHASRKRFEALTTAVEALGIFQTGEPIGFRRQWNELLANTGYRLDNHTLVPIGNETAIGDPDNGVALLTFGPVARHLTALSRDRLSAPIRFLETFGYLNGSFSIFDYGCGKGDDLKYLHSINVPSNGWDPHYRPNEPLIPSDIVNLGFVINVIEDLAERHYALTQAFALARIAIVVSTMLTSDQRKLGRPFRDGYLTSIGTFQKYYLQSELQSFIDSVLDASPIPIGPGVFLVFKDKTAEASFLASRVRSDSRARIRFSLEPREHTHKRERKARTHELSSRQAELLDGLWSAMLDIGRMPSEAEIENAAELTQHFGSFRSAVKAISNRYDQGALSEAATQRQNELLVMLAIHHFRRTGRAIVADKRLRNDIVGLFGSLRTAQRSALELIADLRNEETLRKAIQGSLERGIGTLIESKGFMVHRSLITRLPPQLQVMIWAASLLSDGLEVVDLIRIHERIDKVSFYQHDLFESPLPRLKSQSKVDIGRLKTIDRYFTNDQDFRLIGKSRFLNEESLEFTEARKFDRILSSILLDEPSQSQIHIPMDSLSDSLRQSLFELEGQTLVRSKRVPGLDENCGRFLTYRDLIDCGETQTRLMIDNAPENAGSYAALLDLATNILDPVIEYYGSIRLTYGFCSNGLRKHIKTRVAPKLDQHAAHELNSKGQLVCSRLGAAVDFIVEDEDMSEVVKWISDNLDFDRIYYYGPDRPIHVSFSEAPVRQITEMFLAGNGRRIPRPFKQGSA